MSERTLVTLNELLSTTKDGDWGQGEPTEDHIPAHVIRGTDFGDVALGRITGVPVRYLPSRTVERRTLQVNDILIETAGGSRDRPTGRTVLITANRLSRFPGITTCASFARFLRVDSRLADPRYVFWALQDLYNRGGTWEHQVQHTGVARFQYTRFASTWQLPLPSRSVQQAVSEVLGALDDKVAVNDHIAVTSLALTDALYERSVANIETGEETFASMADVFGGGTPRTAEPGYWNGDIAWTTPTDVTALTSPYLFDTKRKITHSGLENCPSKLYPAGSIFMTSRATIGAFAIPQLPAAVNQGFIVVIPRSPNLRWWLFHEMRSRLDDMLNLANGSTFLELSRKNFKSMQVRLADARTIAQFDAEADALHKRAAQSALEVRTLVELRDTMLPRLMSGEIKVRDAERVVEEAV